MIFVCFLLALLAFFGLIYSLTFWLDTPLWIQTGTCAVGKTFFWRLVFYLFRRTTMRSFVQGSFFSFLLFMLTCSLHFFVSTCP